MPYSVANISLHDNTLQERWIQTAFCFINFSHKNIHDTTKFLHQLLPVFKIIRKRRKVTHKVVWQFGYQPNFFDLFSISNILQTLSFKAGEILLSSPSITQSRFQEYMLLATGG